MIRHVPNSSEPYHLYTRDGSRLLGKHETREKAEAQETAINIRKHASIGTAVAKPLITALLGTPYTATSKIKALTTPWAARNELNTRLLGALTGGYYGLNEALSDGMLNKLTGYSLSSDIENLAPLPKALAIAAAVSAGAAIGSRVGGAGSALKHITAEKIKPLLQQHPDYLKLLMDQIQV